MRIARLFPLAALFVAAMPADAGLRASYGSNPDAAPLVVEVGDNGDARIGEPDDASYGLLIGGIFYVVQTQEGGTMAARLGDVAAAVDEAIGPVFGGALDRTGPPQPVAKITSRATGKRNVGGREGTVYAISGLDQNQPDRAIDYVFSADPALAPVGRALEGFMNASLVPGAPLMGSATAELIEETRAIFTLGTPIDVGGRFQLQSVTEAKIDPARLRLPVTPTTRAALVTAMKAAAVKKR